MVAEKAHHNSYLYMFPFYNSKTFKQKILQSNGKVGAVTIHASPFRRISYSGKIRSGTKTRNVYNRVDTDVSYKYMSLCNPILIFLSLMSAVL